VFKKKERKERKGTSAQLLQTMFSPRSSRHSEKIRRERLEPTWVALPKRNAYMTKFPLIHLSKKKDKCRRIYNSQVQITESCITVTKFIYVAHNFHQSFANYLIFHNLLLKFRNQFNFITKAFNSHPETLLSIDLISV